MLEEQGFCRGLRRRLLFAVSPCIIYIPNDCVYVWMLLTMNEHLVLITNGEVILPIVVKSILLELQD